MIFRVLILPVFLWGCDETETAVYGQCSLAFEELSPNPAAAGVTVQARLAPQSDSMDTILHLNGQQLAIDSMDRENCEACDECRTQAQCTPCNDCPSCGGLCESECRETISFELPEIPVGEHLLQVTNVYGQSPLMSIHVEATGPTNPPETDTGSATDTDTGSATDTDSGSSN